MPIIIHKNIFSNVKVDLDKLIQLFYQFKREKKSTHLIFY